MSAPSAPTPASLRPFTFGEILDHAFLPYRQQFGVFAGIALLAMGPYVVLETSSAAAAASVDRVDALALFVYFLAYMFAVGALTHALAAMYEGRKARLGEALRVGLRVWPYLTLASVLSYLLMFVGFVIFILPGFVLLASFFAVEAVVVLEGRSPPDALQRSWELSSGDRWRILGLLSVAYVIQVLPEASLWLLLEGVGWGTGVEADAYLATALAAGSMTVLTSTLSALLLPFAQAVIVLLYFDRRARTEPQELEARMDELQGEARE